MRTVRKPGEEILAILEQWGRLICDYRGINLATIKELVEAEHMGQMLDFIAGSLWVSLLDLLWRFNHMVLTRRASELLSLITSVGYLSPTVMQFGVHNGPTSMQATVRRVFRRLGRKFRVFIDDCCAGTVGSDDPRIPDPCDENSEAAMGMLEHALFDFVDMVLTAVMEGMKYKVAKMFALQLIVTALGFVCGRGTISVDPRKIDGIVHCPRPMRPGDVDSYLGGTSFIRNHFAPAYAVLSRTLRQALKAKLERDGWTRASGRKKLSALVHFEEVIEETGEKISYIGTFRFIGAESARMTVYRSGTLPWTVEMETDFREMKRLVVVPSTFMSWTWTEHLTALTRCTCCPMPVASRRGWGVFSMLRGHAWKS